MSNWALTAEPAGKWCVLWEAQLSRNHSLVRFLAVNEVFFFLLHSKPPFFPPPRWVRVPGSEEQLVTLPPGAARELGPPCARPSRADLDSAWRTPFPHSPLGEICCNLTLFPRERARARLCSAPLLANPSEKETLVELLAHLWKRPFQGQFRGTFAETCVAACCSRWGINWIWLSAAAFGTFH